MLAADANALRVFEFLIPPIERIGFVLTSQDDQLEEIAFTTEALLTLRSKSDTRRCQQNIPYKAVDRYDDASFQFSPVQYENLDDRCFRFGF